MCFVCPISVSRGLREQAAAWLLAIVASSLIAPSAQAVVRRRLNVNSNPQGALVYVDNQQIGTTPCSVDFTYYGTREIRLIKPGYETLTVNQPIPAPWYQYTPIDFVAENLVTTKIRDKRTVNYNMAPQLVVPPQELISRADQLRQDTLQHGTPTPGTPIPVTGAPAPFGASAPPTALPPINAPETLPGIPVVPPGPPMMGQPPVGQPVYPPAGPTPVPASGGAPLIPPRLN